MKENKIGIFYGKEITADMTKEELLEVIQFCGEEINRLKAVDNKCTCKYELTRE